MKSNLSPFLRGVVASLEDDQTRDGVVVAETPEEAEAAVADATTEISEATGELEQIEGDVQTLEEAATGVESIILSLEAAQLDGGLTPQSAMFMNIALASYADRVGVDVASVPSVESFGGASARLASTVASLEASKGIWETIKEAILKAWKAVRDFMVGLWNKLFDGATALKTYAEKLAKAVDKAEVKTEDVKFSKAYLLTTSKKFDALKALKSASDRVTENTEYAEKALGTITGLGQVFKDAIKGSSEEEFTRALISLRPINPDGVDDWKPTSGKDGLRGYTNTVDLPGNTQFIYVFTPAEFANSDSAFYKALGRVAMSLPGSIQVIIDEKAYDGETVKPATKGELNGIAKNVIELANKVIAAKAAFAKAAKAEPVIPENSDKNVTSAIRSLAKEYSRGHGRYMKLGGKINAWALKIGNAAVKYGFASIK